MTFRKIWNTAHGIYAKSDKNLDARRRDLLEYLQGMANEGHLTKGEVEVIFEDMTEAVDYWQRRAQA
jgi:hypothetical protein